MRNAHREREKKGKKKDIWTIRLKGKKELNVVFFLKKKKKKKFKTDMSCQFAGLSLLLWVIKKRGWDWLKWMIKKKGGRGKGFFWLWLREDFFLLTRLYETNGEGKRGRWFSHGNPEICVHELYVSQRFFQIKFFKAYYWIIRISSTVLCLSPQK